MSTNLVIGPVLIPFFTAILLLLTYKSLLCQKLISLAAGVAALGYAVYLFLRVQAQGILIYYAGDWQPPFGITLVADRLACIMLLISAVVGLVCLIYSLQTVDEGRLRHFYCTLFQMLLVGVNGSFLTGDIFNLFVFFEIMLMSSYVLLVLGSERGQLRETFKYLIINSLASTLFLVGLGLVYSLSGTLNMADIAQKFATLEDQSLVTLVGVIFLVVFGLKGAIFPLYYWLPQSYYEPPAAVSALFIGLLTKVGVYALIRVFTLIFVHDLGFTHLLLLILAALTMIFGVLGAVCQKNFKRILTYHTISQVGYMIAGLGLHTWWSLTAAIYFIIHHSVVKTNLFLVAGVTEKITGTNQLSEMGGLLRRYPWLGWTFLLTALSLAGLPPLSGFFAKFTLVVSAVAAGQPWLIAVALGVGLLTLFSMIKIFLYVFWGEEKPVPVQPGFHYRRWMPVCLLMAALSLALGLAAAPVLEQVSLAAQQLLDPTLYIEAVLGAAF